MPSESIMWVPDNIREKYFFPTKVPGVFQIDNEIKECVSYIQHDLLSFKKVGTNFCLIICKNVLMHFPHNDQSAVIAMSHHALRPGGFLALDHNQELPLENTNHFEQIYPGKPLFRKRDETR